MHHHKSKQASKQARSWRETTPPAGKGKAFTTPTNAPFVF
jgi:hypothetical protein